MRSLLILDGARYLGKLKEAIEAIHEAGVVHLDLYTSNVMWRMEGDELEMKIVDWDGAQVLGSGLAPMTSSALHSSKRKQLVHQDSATACPLWDQCCLQVMEHAAQKPDLKTEFQGEKDRLKLNAAFRLACDSLVECTQ